MESESARRHKRRSIRLKDYDYSQEGAYFITLCIRDRIRFFGSIVDEKMIMNRFGRIVEEEWHRTERVRPDFFVDEFAVMPDHFHGIVFITKKETLNGTKALIEPVGAHRSAPFNHPAQANGLIRKPRTIGSFVASFKAITTKRINLLRMTPGVSIWQRGPETSARRGGCDL